MRGVWVDVWASNCQAVESNKELIFSSCQASPSNRSIVLSVAYPAIGVWDRHSKPKDSRLPLNTDHSWGTDRVKRSGAWVKAACVGPVFHLVCSGIEEGSGWAVHIQSWESLDEGSRQAVGCVVKDCLFPCDRGHIIDVGTKWLSWNVTFLCVYTELNSLVLGAFWGIEVRLSTHWYD